MDISEKIVLLITIWVIILLFIVPDMDLEIYFILVFLGLFFIIEFTQHYLTTKVKKRLRMLIIVCIIIFIVLAGIKIINFLGT